MKKLLFISILLLALTATIFWWQSTELGEHKSRELSLATSASHKPHTQHGEASTLGMTPEAQRERIATRWSQYRAAKTQEEILIALDELAETCPVELTEEIFAEARKSDDDKVVAKLIRVISRMPELLDQRQFSDQALAQHLEKLQSEFGAFLKEHPLEQTAALNAAYAIPGIFPQDEALTLIQAIADNAPAEDTEFRADIYGAWMETAVGGQIDNVAELETLDQFSLEHSDELTRKGKIRIIDVALTNGQLENSWKDLQTLAPLLEPAPAMDDAYINWLKLASKARGESYLSLLEQSLRGNDPKIQAAIMSFAPADTLNSIDQEVLLSVQDNLIAHADTEDAEALPMIRTALQRIPSNGGVTFSMGQ